MTTSTDIAKAILARHRHDSIPHHWAYIQKAERLRDDARDAFRGGNAPRGRSLARQADYALIQAWAWIEDYCFVNFGIR